MTSQQPTAHTAAQTPYRTPQPKPLVLFDGGCPLCAREIAHYRRLRAASGIIWIDIHRERDTVEGLGISPADAMARFHVRDASARWHTGAGAFVELWSHLPYYALLATVTRRLHLVGPLNWAYERFAAWRLNRRCSDGTCATAVPQDRLRRPASDTKSARHHSSPN